MYEYKYHLVSTEFYVNFLRRFTYFSHRNVMRIVVSAKDDCQKIPQHRNLLFSIYCLQSAIKIHFITNSKIIESSRN